MIRVLLVLVSLFSVGHAVWAAGLESGQYYSAAETSPWEKILEDTQNRVDALLEDNDQLMREHQALTEEIAQAQKMLHENKSPARAKRQTVVPVEREGLSADARELRQQISEHTEAIAIKEQELQWLNKKLNVHRTKVELLNLRLSELELQNKKILSDQGLQASVDQGQNDAEEIARLTEELDRLREAERALENKVAELGPKKDAEALSAQQIKRQDQEMEEEFSRLQLERTKLIQSIKGDVEKNLAKAPAEQKEYWTIVQSKIALEEQIVDLENTMQMVNDPKYQAPSEGVKEAMVDEVMEIDNENQMILEQIRHLKENVEFLRGQIKNLEGRTQL